MKNIITKWAAWIVIGAMFALLIPGIALRVTNEAKNDNVVISFLYNDIRNKVSDKVLSDTLDECVDMGINVVSVMEEDLNNMVSRGDVTSIKYNVLRHKYDDESMRIADKIAEVCPNVAYDSHIVLAKKSATRKMLAEMFPKKYTKNEYMKIENVEGMDIYVLYDGRKDLWNYTFGYNEDIIADLSERGFKIALVHKIVNYPKTDYLKDIDRIVKEYDVEYLNVKEATQDNFDKNDKNYKGIADIITNNNMTLVVTEKGDQLSNQKFEGYSEVFNSVMGEGGTGKVLRSYETHDDSQDDGSHYKYRTEQLFNSTIDRNIRFITLTQIATADVTYEECAEFTLKAAKLYMDKISNLGYTINADTQAVEYNANRKLNCGASAAIMVMALLIMYQMLSGKKCFKLTCVALVLAACGFAVCFVLPDVLLSLCPTAYCVVMSCFAMTVLLEFIKFAKEKLNTIVLALASVIVVVVTLLIGSIGMGAMLSGINYYVNNDIFRGIKLSLMIPVFYTAVIYYFMFMKNDNTTLAKDIKSVLFADIKVYWVLIAGFIGIIGAYYIIRSGNVNSISGIEQAMRSAITEIFPARPRTKEFLVGYPCLVLFVYYIKNHDIKLLQWILAVGASILAASVTNSFCHVFTGYTTICMRVVNGILIGACVSIAAYVGNYVLVKIIQGVAKKLSK